MRAGTPSCPQVRRVHIRTSGLGRPLIDAIAASRLQNLKELRPETVRILSAFVPWRFSILSE
jgi:hypothetical protein